MSNDTRIATVIIDAPSDNGWHSANGMILEIDMSSRGPKEEGEIAYFVPNTANNDKIIEYISKRSWPGVYGYYSRQDIHIQEKMLKKRPIKNNRSALGLLKKEDLVCVPKY